MGTGHIIRGSFVIYKNHVLIIRIRKKYKRLVHSSTNQTKRLS